MPRRNQTPQHQPFQFVSNCQQKRRYASKQQAEATAEHQMLVHPDIVLTVYQCELCGGWHLTRQTGR